MTEVVLRANCPACVKDVHLIPSEIQARVCSDTDTNSYAFTCPACGAAIAKQASRRIIDILVSEGVRLTVWKFPAEFAEAHHGPPLTNSDLFSFVCSLAKTQYLTEYA